MAIQGPRFGAPGIQPLIEPRVSRPAALPNPTSPAEPKEVSLASILTPEERAFFEERASLGPLTYRPGPRTQQTAGPRGQRIDLRA